MARLRSILKAIALASWREARTVLSIAGQNLFLFVAFVALQPESAAFFVLILAAIVVFPLSTDPMEAIPRERWRLWPLNDRERVVIRSVSIAFSPVTWIAALLLLRAGWRAGIEFLALVISVKLALYFIARWSARLPQANVWLWIPAPPGITGALMRLHWREMLTTLDPYVALLLAECTKLYQLSGKPLDPAALRIMSLVTVVAMSTSAQLLIGLDGAGAERYRYLHIRGWQILWAKDLAFLALLAFLVAPLDWISGLSAGIAALTVGHHRSIMQNPPQLRWRFTSGILVPDGILQTIALFAVGNSARTLGFAVIGPCLLCWLLSLCFLDGNGIVKERNTAATNRSSNR